MRSRDVWAHGRQLPAAGLLLSCAGSGQVAAADLQTQFGAKGRVAAVQAACRQTSCGRMLQHTSSKTATRPAAHSQNRAAAHQASRTYKLHVCCATHLPQGSLTRQARVCASSSGQAGSHTAQASDQTFCKELHMDTELFCLFCRAWRSKAQTGKYTRPSIGS